MKGEIFATLGKNDAFLSEKQAVLYFALTISK